VITPVLVQTDRSVIVVIAVCALCAVVGVIGEQQFSRREWLVLYVVGALVGHAIGEVFQPRQGGTSVAFAAILGALAARAVTGSLRVPRPVRVEAAIAVPLAIVDTIAHDIHGLPFLAGFVIVLALDRRAAARAP
jgi:membrane associated rhomboid family serine protease